MVHLLIVFLARRLWLLGFVFIALVFLLLPVESRGPMWGARGKVQVLEPGVWYVVQPADTIEEIARHYHTTARAISRTNHLTGTGAIYILQRLWIPGTSETDRPSPSGIWAMVKVEDTLNSIARRYGTTAQIIARFNHLEESDNLEVGQRLWIPGGTLEPSVILLSPPENAWRAYYFANKELQGSFVHSEEVVEIDYDWGMGRPPGLPGDEFSAVWNGVFDFDASGYRFLVTVDDGARLYIDDVLLLDAWQDQSPTGYFADILLSKGQHSLRLEYYDAGGTASIFLSWRQL